MPIVFRFDSMDARERATLVIDTPEAAAKHVTKVLNQGRRSGPGLWTFDEDGKQVPKLRDLVDRLRGDYRVKLHDQSSNCGHSATVEQAFAVTR